MTLARIAFAVPFTLLLAACGGEEAVEGTSPAGAASGAIAEDVASVLDEARACRGGEAGPFEFSAGNLTALDDAPAFNAALSQSFMEGARTQQCVFTLASGLSFRIDRAVDEDAPSPVSGDVVTVHYEGKLVSGQVFDSSYARDEPATFPSNRLIAGWVEALPLMREGEEWTLFIPAELAYGANPRPGGPITPNQALTFRLELLDLPQEDAATE